MMGIFAALLVWKGSIARSLVCSSACDTRYLSQCAGYAVGSQSGVFMLDRPFKVQTA